MQKYVTKNFLTTELSTVWHEADNIPFCILNQKITRCGDTDTNGWDRELLKYAIKYLIDVMLPPFHLLSTIFFY